jgi:hypothetical protein
MARSGSPIFHIHGLSNRFSKQLLAQPLSVSPYPSITPVITNKRADEAKCPLFNNMPLQTLVITVID